MGRHEMNLKHVNSLKGTGTGTDQDEKPYSSQPFLDYVYLMFEFMIVLVLFCFITTNNYLNAQTFDKATEYPIGEKLSDLISKTKTSPYCSSYAECNSISVEKSDTVSNFSWWFQTTQETVYRILGFVMHYYLWCLQYLISYPDGIPCTGYISFIRWILFGFITIFLIILILSFMWVAFIPGWVAGLFAFMKLKINSLDKTGLFFLSMFLTFLFGWVSAFPVISEFVRFSYIFSFKQIVSNSDNYGTEFSKRIPMLIIIFNILAVVFSWVQLPNSTAGVITGFIFVAMLFFKNQSLKKNKE